MAACNAAGQVSNCLHASQRSTDPDAIIKVPVIAALPKAAIPTVFVNELFDPAEPVFGQHFSGSSQNKLNGRSQMSVRIRLLVADQLFRDLV
jgi:hypothetical protein